MSPPCAFEKRIVHKRPTVMLIFLHIIMFSCEVYYHVNKRLFINKVTKTSDFKRTHLW